MLLERNVVNQLQSCTLIAQCLNILLARAAGSDKSWFACAIAKQACRQSYRSLYARMPDLAEQLDAASDNAAGDVVAGDTVSAAGDAADDAMLIADNARTIAVGSGSVAAAAGLPLAFGWFVRRRLGLDAAAELDKRLGL